MSKTAILTTAIALLALPAAAHAQAPDDAPCRPGSGATAVFITVDGFKSRDGTIRVEMWPGTQEDFLRDHHLLVAEGKPYERVIVPTPTSGPAKICVKLPGPGTYAIGAVHSPSGERKFNFRRDGVSFTRNPRVGLRKPRANEVAVTYGPGLSQEVVTLNYLRGLAFRPVPQEELQSAERQQ